VKVALDIVPFTRTIWKTESKENLWQDRLNRISSMFTQAEYLTVKNGYRDVATIHVDMDNGLDILSRIAVDGLVFLPIAVSAKYQGFSHRHIAPAPNQDRFIYGVLARDKDTAMKFKIASNDPNKVHLEVGRMLGYPECCTIAFNDRWKRGKIDPMWETAIATGTKEVSEPMEDEGYVHYITIKPYVECNQLLRYFGIRLTSHLPCSFQCNRTKDMAWYWKDTMRSIDRKAYLWLIKLLSMPLEWNAYRGILQVNTNLFLGVTTTGYTEDKYIIRVT